MNETENANDMDALRREVVVLREELESLKRLLNISGNLRERRNRLSLQCASLEVLDASGASVVALAASESGGVVELRASGDSPRVALIATPEGANLALCGPNGTPRVVLQSREEGGGVSFVDENGDLAAELWGATEASWMSLLHEGRTAVVSVAATEGGNLEVFDRHDALLASLPLHTKPLYSPQ